MKYQLCSTIISANLPQSILYDALIFAMMILEAIHDQIVKMQVTRVRRRRKSLLRRQIGKLLKLLLLQQQCCTGLWI